MPSDEILRAKRDELQKRFTDVKKRIADLGALEGGLAEGARKFEVQADIEHARTEFESLAQQIEEIESQRLLSAMLTMDYDNQVTPFRDYLGNRQIGAFLIRGAPDYGHLWVLAQMLTYIPRMTITPPIPFDMLSSSLRKDVKALWRELGKQLGLSLFGTTQEQVLERVRERLKTQNLIIIMRNVDVVGAELFEQIANQFWSPLANAAQAALVGNSQSVLMLFLVDYDDKVSQWNLPLADVASLDDIKALAPKPDLLIRLPSLGTFDENLLVPWMKFAAKHVLPAEIVKQAQQYAQQILQQSNNGVPEYVVSHLCELCQTVYEGEEVWLKL